MNVNKRQKNIVFIDIHKLCLHFTKYQKYIKKKCGTNFKISN